MEPSPSRTPAVAGREDARVVESARRIMAAFARRTGLAEPAGPRRRYVWTDAFAVCNWLELHRRGDPDALGSALRLVEQVHETLGRHRPDDPRTGWISGLSEEDGRAHPTAGGLRIGKALAERAPGEAPDERLEWERDGQYFHYLTRWMHALGRVARVAEERRFLRQAVELALCAWRAFTYTPPGGGGRRMVWKMSIDLSRPQVASMGHHDPLDGALTLRALRAAAQEAGWSEGAEALRAPIADLRAMCAGVDWATLDPLGLGGLLCDALRAARLADEGDPADARLPAILLEDCRLGLSGLARSGELVRPLPRRLAFRELGLAIGLRAVPRLEALVARRAVRSGEAQELARGIEGLRPFLPLAERIEAAWLDPAARATELWREHLDIDEVMLATSLLPDGYLSP